MYRLNYGLEYAALRYPNVYGPRQDPNGEAGVVAIFTGQMLAGEPVTINGDGDQERDFVYVGDCARANVLAADSRVESGIYNLGSGRGTSVNEIFEALRLATDYHQPARYGPAKLGETRRIFLDAGKARSEMAWAPEVELKDGLADTVEYFRRALARRVA
jgi:UDP-glucose 4-epimerase